MPQGITLWRSKRGGKERGFILASWREGGRKVSWNTRTMDRTEALAKASAEVSRRLSTPARPAPPPPAAPPRVVQPDQVVPPPSSAGTSTETPSTTTTNGASRRPIGEALTRALGNGTSPAAAINAPATDDEAKAKVKKLYEVFGKAMSYLTEGGLKRAVQWAGREPEEMDDDELELVREGWEEKGADWFGAKNIGPWGKIALGSAVAGVGMYMHGKPVPKPPAKPKELPAQQQQQTGEARPDHERGGGGG